MATAGKSRFGGNGQGDRSIFGDRSGRAAALEGRIAVCKTYGNAGEIDTAEIFDGDRLGDRIVSSQCETKIETRWIDRDGQDRCDGKDKILGGDQVVASRHPDSHIVIVSLFEIPVGLDPDGDLAARLNRRDAGAA